MGLTPTTWVVIIVGGAVTFLLRGSFLVVAERVVSTSEDRRLAFRMLPAAALAALAFPALLRPDGALELTGPRPIVAVVALVIAFWTRSLIWTIAGGLLLVVGLDALR